MALIVSSKEYELDISHQETLAQILRHRLDLYGVHVSCDVGECGSCTVLLDGRPVASCLLQAMQAEGKEITTIEGMGTYDELYPIQEVIIKEQDLKFSYCLPGVILTTRSLIERNPKLTPIETVDALNWYICRCGAYSHIARSVIKAGKEIESTWLMPRRS